MEMENYGWSVWQSWITSAEQFQKIHGANKKHNDATWGVVQGTGLEFFCFYTWAWSEACKMGSWIY